MIGRRGGAWLAAAACCWLAVAASAARAQLVDCPAIHYASSYKIVVDDLFFAKPVLDADADLKLLMDRLRFTVNNQLTALALQMRGATQQSTPLSTEIPLSLGINPQQRSYFLTTIG